MAKVVDFKNTSGQTLYVEVGKPNNLLERTPEIYDNDFDGHAKLALIDVYGMFFPDGDGTKKPFVYLRHTDVSKNEYRFANLVELGDDFLSPQKGAYHVDEIATPETPIIEYQKITENPLVYGFGSEEKLVECRFHKDYVTMKEGDFFNIKGEPWSHTIYDHQSVYNNASMIFQPTSWIGSFKGKPILGLGEFDRMFIKEAVEGFGDIPLGYIAFMGIGIREDGRKETTFISISINGVGKTLAYYILEGEQPIVTDQVSMEADWTRLPYVDDGTCVFKDAIFRFCDKEIHFEGKWGSKGFTAKPRVEKHGQSHVLGTWYEGNKPYKHRLYYTFVENMDAYDYNLEKLGFDIIG
ncbi:hypothetical protein [Breznakia pachnodae]|uniref:Uncharacterized protein n=1 Tax=Breznakia pachnodae TaxID=265178 RepID=A0ABU0E856_9FIRM|nr:hypothetical protein [Breznakia pachnodae]MDQ0363000.1 hypothetical protein [Breznakia pachnodae]